MRAYYGFTKKGNAFVYIPYHLAGISLDGLHFKFRFDLPFLERLDKGIRNRKISLDSLAERGWDLKEVDINEHYLRAFRNVIYNSPNEIIDKEAYGITELVACIAENMNDKREEDLWDDEDDYEDDWWKRGDKAPFLEE